MLASPFKFESENERQSTIAAVESANVGRRFSRVKVNGHQVDDILEINIEGMNVRQKNILQNLVKMTHGIRILDISSSVMVIESVKRSSPRMGIFGSAYQNKTGHLGKVLVSIKSRLDEIPVLRSKNQRHYKPQE